MKECQKADGNGCSFIYDDGACIPSLPKLTLVLQKSKPSQQQQQKSKIWNYICQIIACSLLEDSNLDMKKIKKKVKSQSFVFRIHNGRKHNGKEGRKLISENKFMYKEHLKNLFEASAITIPDIS